MRTYKKSLECPIREAFEIAQKVIEAKAAANAVAETKKKRSLSLKPKASKPKKRKRQASHPKRSPSDKKPKKGTLEYFGFINKKSSK